MLIFGFRFSFSFSGVQQHITYVFALAAAQAEIVWYKTSNMYAVNL